MSNSHLEKLKSGIKNGIEATLNLLSNMIGDYNGESNFLHKLLLTDTQVSRTREVFAYSSSANINFSKAQPFKMIKPGGVIRNIPIFDSILSNLAEQGRDIARDLEKDFLDKQIDK